MLKTILTFKPKTEKEIGKMITRVSAVDWNNKVKFCDDDPIKFTSFFSDTEA